MWIELNRKHDDGRLITQSIKLEGMDEAVSFSENGKAQVTATVGEYLTDEIESIEATENEDSEETTNG